jgi:predicted ATPase
MAEKAVHYWLLAGKLSVAKSAVEEAVAQLRRSLGLLNGLPDTLERSRLELDLVRHTGIAGKPLDQS